MKKFRFSLETVLKVRRQAEELRQRELAEAQALRDRSLHQLAGLENDLRELLTVQSEKRLGLLDMNAEAWFRARHEGISRAKQEKLQAKEGKEKKKARAKKEKDDRKRHLANQDKATRKRIKRNTKRADRNGTNAHRDPWPQRWFVKH